VPSQEAVETKFVADVAVVALVALVAFVTDKKRNEGSKKLLIAST
jgi:hypothetical protein